MKDDNSHYLKSAVVVIKTLLPLYVQAHGLQKKA